MAIEVHEGGGMTITGPHIEYARYVTVAAGLALEINTGMKMSHGRSVVQVANSITGGTSRTKVGALQDLHDALTEHVPGYKPLPSVVKALGLVEAHTVKVGDTIHIVGHHKGKVLQIDGPDRHGVLVFTVKLPKDKRNEASGFHYATTELVAVKRNGDV